MRPVITSKAVEATAGTIIDPTGELRKYGIKGTDIPSAPTIDLGAANGDYVRITGTTSISSFGVAPAGVVRTVEFTGILTIIYNSANLVLPGSANLVTAPNDTAIFRSRGSGAWICVSYQTASGSTPLELTKDDVGLGNVENVALSTWPGSTNLVTVGTITTGNWQGTPISPQKGGTGLTALVQGDIIYGSAANVYSRLAKNTSLTRYVTNQGPTNNPAWGQIDLTNGVTGVLPYANGGRGADPVTGSNVQTITPPGGVTLTIDLALGYMCLLSLASASGNVTLTLSNPTAGLINMLVVTQGATLRNLIFPAGTKQSLAGGTTWIPTAISKVDVITFVYDGSVYYILGTVPDVA
jgi:hypothetical protein